MQKRSAKKLSALTLGSTLTAAMLWPTSFAMASQRPVAISRIWLTLSGHSVRAAAIAPAAQPLDYQFIACPGGQESNSALCPSGHGDLAALDSW